MIIVYLPEMLWILCDYCLSAGDAILQDGMHVAEMLTYCLCVTGVSFCLFDFGDCKDL